jgi:hypothetical protein
MCFDAHSDNKFISYRLMRIGHKLNNMQFYFYSLATLFGPSSARERPAYAIFVLIITIVVIFFHLVLPKLWPIYRFFLPRYRVYRHAFVGRHDRSPALPVRPASAAGDSLLPLYARVTHNRSRYYYYYYSMVNCYHSHRRGVHCCLQVTIIIL